MAASQPPKLYGLGSNPRGLELLLVIMEELKKIAVDKVSDPLYFGKIFWSVLEILALTDKEWFDDFMKIITRKLPCKKCHTHLLFKLSQLDKEKYDPFEFVISLHNLANELQGKKTYTELERIEEILKS